MNNFIKTSDKETADQLKKAGFVFIQQESGIWVFLNNGPMVFSEEEKKKISYSNVISV